MQRAAAATAAVQVVGEINVGVSGDHPIESELLPPLVPARADAKLTPAVVRLPPGLRTIAVFTATLLVMVLLLAEFEITMLVVNTSMLPVPLITVALPLKLKRLNPERSRTPLIVLDSRLMLRHIRRSLVVPVPTIESRSAVNIDRRSINGNRSGWLQNRGAWSVNGNSRHLRSDCQRGRLECYCSYER